MTATLIQQPIPSASLGLIAPSPGAIGLKVHKNNYQTERSVAIRMIDLAKFYSGGDLGRACEPTAGIGSIARFAPEGCQAIEIEPRYAKCGRINAPHCDWVQGDFFELCESLPRPNTIVANPPYSDGIGNDFIEAFGHFLEWGGVLVLLLNFNSYCTHTFHEALAAGSLKLLRFSPLVGRQRFVHPETGEPMPSKESALHDAAIYVCRKQREPISDTIVRPIFMSAGTIAPELPTREPSARYSPENHHGCNGCVHRGSFGGWPCCLNPNNATGDCPVEGCELRVERGSQHDLVLTGGGS